MMLLALPVRPNDAGEGVTSERSSPTLKTRTLRRLTYILSSTRFSQRVLVRRRTENHSICSIGELQAVRAVDSLQVVSRFCQS